MRDDKKKEWGLLSIYQAYARFFADRDQGMEICRSFTDWGEHDLKGWELDKKLNPIA